MKLIVLYLGDIMGRPGRDVVSAVLPELRREVKADLVVAQAENVSHGKGMTPGHMQELHAAGVDFFTGGNHSIERASTKALLQDPAQPVTAPMNQTGVKPEWGSKEITTPKGRVLIATLLGNVFPTPFAMTNPLQMADTWLASVHPQDYAAIIINFHADLSSEKRVMGYYLDGKVSAVIGDHWHVPTADAMVLPGGTAHITDVGMCGTLHSSLGVSKDTIIARWRDGAKLKNDIAEGGPWQVNGLVVAVDTATRLAIRVKPINKIVEKLG